MLFPFSSFLRTRNQSYPPNAASRTVLENCRFLKLLNSPFEFYEKILIVFNPLPMTTIRLPVLLNITFFSTDSIEVYMFSYAEMESLLRLYKRTEELVKLPLCSPARTRVSPRIAESWIVELGANYVSICLIKDKFDAL